MTIRTLLIFLLDEVIFMKILKLHLSYSFLTAGLQATTNCRLPPK